MTRSAYFSSVACAALLAIFASDGLAADDPGLVARGEYLARAGDCMACHTGSGGPFFAGGDALNSPFGAIYPPNITPDKATGIGNWSEDDFYRALHDGKGLHGEYLYPAFPYPWFTKVTREDVKALKAYLDTVKPVNQKSRQDKLTFPFDIRLGLAGWDAAFFKAGEFKPDPSKSKEWNRGAYLVEGLGHCGDCHTPKGPAEEPIDSKAFSGGSLDKWYAPNITSDKAHGIGGWSDEDLVKYLKTGSAPGRGTAAGPMAQTIRDSLSYLTDEDLHAIVAYLKATPPIAEVNETRGADASGPHAPGEALYLTHCAYCHQADGKGRSGAVPALDGNGLVRARGPEDVIRIVLGGHLATDSYALMPAVGADMSDRDVAAVVDYVRNAWSNVAPAISKDGMVGEIRAETETLLSGPWRDKKDPCHLGPDAPAIKPIVDPQHQIDQALGSMTGETMLTTIGQLIARARQVAPDATQSDIVNDLTRDYCEVEAHKEGTSDADKRRQLTRFSELVYTQIASNGKD
jgi:mono/diheme cytochrome c family protein